MQFAAGAGFSGALTDKGRVYLWGRRDRARRTSVAALLKLAKLVAQLGGFFVLFRFQGLGQALLHLFDRVVPDGLVVLGVLLFERDRGRFPQLLVDVHGGLGPQGHVDGVRGARIELEFVAVARDVQACEERPLLLIGDDDS